MRTARQMNHDNPCVSVIIVNYNGRKYLYDCVSSLFNQTKELSLEVFVIDNNSTDGSAEEIAQAFPQVTLIKNLKNVGFAKANNIALTKSRGKYIMLLNPDTVILDRAIEKLVAFLDKSSQASAVGCKLLNDDLSLQRSIGSFPSWTNQIARTFNLHRLLPMVSVFQEIITANSRYSTTHPVDWLFGAAIVIRRDTVDEIGLLDDSFFLFSEEKDWCYRLKGAGKHIFYYPDAEIIHYGRGSTTNPKSFTLLALGRLKFIKKHYSTLAYGAFFILTILTMLRNTVIWGALKYIPTQRKRAAQRYAAHRQAFLQLVRFRETV